MVGLRDFQYNPMSSKRQKSSRSREYVVLGGGIAGVCCAKELSRLYPNELVTVISRYDVLKETSSTVKVTNHLHELKVFERTSDCFRYENSKIEVIVDEVQWIDYAKNTCYLKDNDSVMYSKLCICSGAAPKTILKHPNILTIRDLCSVQELSKRLRHARKISVVGNGGIALELIHELRHCDIAWVVRDRYIGSAFFDASAAAFVTPLLLQRINAAEKKLEAISNDLTSKESDKPGHPACEQTLQFSVPMGRDRQSGHYALGPDWMSTSGLLHSLSATYPNTFPVADSEYMRLEKDIVRQPSTSLLLGKLELFYEDELDLLSDDGGRTWQRCSTSNAIDTDQLDVRTVSESDRAFPVILRTNSGKIIGCDFVIAAIGVQPCTDFVARSNANALNARNQLAVDLLPADNSVKIDTCMRTSVPNVFAAGDCSCYAPALNAHSHDNLFFQMKLWSQARFMGMYAAQCMANQQNEFGLDTHFELFAHVTRFFGYKVVMLGRYNAQELGSGMEQLVKQISVNVDGKISHHVEPPASNPTNSRLNVDDKISCGNAMVEGVQVDAEDSLLTASPPHDLEVWLRITPGQEYVKLVVHRGKLIGALLIGDTELEEVMENLILNKLDVGQYGIHLLDPDIDLADYFD